MFSAQIACLCFSCSQAALVWKHQTAIYTAMGFAVSRRVYWICPLVWGMQAPDSFGHHSSLAQLQPSVEDHTTHGRANVIGKQVLTGGVSESPAKTVWTFWCWQSHDPVSPSRGQRCAVSQRMFLWLEKASLELQSSLLFSFFLFTFSTTTQTRYRSCSTNSSNNIGPG